MDTYPRTDIRGDGQVVVIKFSDGMKFEILPAFKNNTIWGWDGTYKYPDSHMGGNWMSTNPKAEQDAIKEKMNNQMDFCMIRVNIFVILETTISKVIICQEY